MTVLHISTQVLGTIHNCQCLNECTKRSLIDLPLKKCTHEHFSNGKFSMNMIKRSVKMWKVYRITVYFPLTLLKCMFCTLV